jgi:DNA-binding winged helix-turn-helix (wHTH) protein
LRIETTCIPAALWRRLLLNRWMAAVACYQFGSHQFDQDNGLVSDGQPVHLSPLQHRLLHTFCKRALTLLSKEERMRDVGSHAAVSDINLSRNVHELRQKLGSGSAAKQLIASVYGRGYIFSPPQGEPRLSPAPPAAPPARRPGTTHR